LLSIDNAAGLPELAVNAKPKLLAGVSIQSCTKLVTSTAKKVLLCVIFPLTATGVPDVGAVLLFTVFSTQLLVTGLSSNFPAEDNVFTYTNKVALATWALVTVGKGLKSKFSKPVVLAEMLTVWALPALMFAKWASAVTGMLVASAVSGKKPAINKAAQRGFSWKFMMFS
jgi:hypothetical protein